MLFCSCPLSGIVNHPAKFRRKFADDHDYIANQYEPSRACEITLIHACESDALKWTVSEGESSILNIATVGSNGWQLRLCCWYTRRGLDLDAAQELLKSSPQ